MSESFRVIHTADLHLGSPFSTWPEHAARLRQEQWTLFSRLIDHCRTARPDLLLIAGDLFDQPVPPSDLVNGVRELLASIPDTNVFIAAGNHDPAFIDSPYRTCAWSDQVRLFTDELNTVRLENQPIQVTGAGFTAAAVTRSLLPPASQPGQSGISSRQLSGSFSQDRLSLLVLHGELVTAGQTSAYNPVTSEQIAALGIDYAALGHRHERSGPQRSGKGWLAYSGCPMGRGFDESGEKGLLSLDLSFDPSDVPEGRVRLQAEWLPLGARRFHIQAVPVDGCSSHEEVYRRIEQELSSMPGSQEPAPLIRTLLTGRLADGFALSPPILQARLAPSHFYAEVIDQTVQIPDLAALTGESSLRGAFARLLVPQMRPDSPDAAQPDLARLALTLGLAAFNGEVSERAYP